MSQAEQRRTKYTELQAKWKAARSTESKLQEQITTYKIRADEMDKRLVLQQGIATRAQKDKETCQTMLKQAVTETKKAGDKLLEASSRIFLLEDELYKIQNHQQRIKAAAATGVGLQPNNDGQEGKKEPGASEQNDGYWNLSSFLWRDISIIDTNNLCFHN